MLVVDTSVLFAARNTREQHHAACTNLLRSEEHLVVPAPVVAETCWMLRSRLNPRHEVSFLDAILDGAFEIVDLALDDYVRVTELVENYERPPLPRISPRRRRPPVSLSWEGSAAAADPTSTPA